MRVHEERDNADAVLEIGEDLRGIVPDPEEDTPDQQPRDHVVQELDPQHDLVPSHLQQHPPQEDPELRPAARREPDVLLAVLLLRRFRVDDAEDVVPADLHLGDRVALAVRYPGDLAVLGGVG